MRYVAAAALAALGGGEVNEANIKKILRFFVLDFWCKQFTLYSYFSSVGIEADGEKVALVVKELAGKNLEEVIAAGTEKLGSVPSGGIRFSTTLWLDINSTVFRWRSCCCCSSCWWRRSCCCCRCCSSSQGDSKLTDFTSLDLFPSLS